MSSKRRPAIQFNRQSAESAVSMDTVEVTQEAIETAQEPITQSQMKEEPPAKKETVSQEVKNTQSKEDLVKPKMTEEGIRLLLRDNPELIETLVDATEEQKIFAVSQKPGILAFIKEQTPEVVKAALNRSVGNFRYVKEQTAQMCEEVVQLDVTQLQWVKDQTEQLCEKALQWSTAAIAYIRQPTEKMRLYAIERHQMAIFQIKVPTSKDIETAAIYHPYVMLNSSKYQHLNEGLTAVALEHYKTLGVKMEDVMSQRIRVPYETTL